MSDGLGQSVSPPRRPVVVKTLWGLRRGEDIPELMEAWDEFSVDYYQEGFNEACEKAIKSWGGDLVAHRYVDLTVDLDAITKHFLPALESAEVKP